MRTGFQELAAQPNGLGWHGVSSEMPLNWIEATSTNRQRVLGWLRG
jgi:hypothetical protein